MLDVTNIQYEKRHDFCVYIQPRLYEFLKQNSINDINCFLETLLQKYKHSLLQIKSMQKLKQASCQYQPKTKNYKRLVLRKLCPELWKRLKALKSLLGYSISYIIRVLLEWEMQNRGISIEPLHLRNLEPAEEIETRRRSQTQPLNNYSYYQYWERRNHSLLSIFLDFP